MGSRETLLHESFVLIQQGTDSTVSFACAAQPDGRAEWEAEGLWEPLNQPVLALKGGTSESPYIAKAFSSLEESFPLMLQNISMN